MTVIILMSVCLYSWVVFRAIQFFQQEGGCRESDKSSVASLMALSVMVIMAEVLVWGSNPWEARVAPVGHSLLLAFNFANAFFYISFIESLTEKKICKVSQRG